MTHPEVEVRPIAFRNDNIDPQIISRLPRIPKEVKFRSARLIGSGLHSEVYSISATYKKQTIIAALKIFSARWKENFEREVHSYEFLEHFSVSGVVPITYGCDTDWNRERLSDVLDNALEPTSPLRMPVSVIMLEYVAESGSLSADNIDWRICKEILRGLYLIHSAQVLHHDIAERNILVVPSTGRVVWIDFSSSYVNPSDVESWSEARLAESLLYQHVVDCLPRCC
jgi:serine/threonine protein kinase